MSGTARATRAIERAAGPSKLLLHALILVPLVFPCSLLAQKSVAPSADEQVLFDSANRERVAQGLQPLKWNYALTEAARRHALRMARQASLSHQLPGEAPVDERAAQAGARFSRIGENVAIGPRASTIHRGWMHSPGHRANILDAHFTALGVGVVANNRGLYAVQDFSMPIVNMTIEAQEEKVAALLAAEGLRVSSDSRKARQSCSDERAPTGPGPMLVLSYDTADIGELPKSLEQKIRERKYRGAEVGACQPRGNAAGFALFRITVLLF